MPPQKRIVGNKFSTRGLNAKSLDIILIVCYRTIDHLTVRGPRKADEWLSSLTANSQNDRSSETWKETDATAG